MSNIELTSFVSPTAIPQFADAEYVVGEINTHILSDYKPNPNHNLRLSALVPNIKYMDKAINNNIKEVAIFTSVSDEFNMKNIRCTILESFNRFIPLMEKAKESNIFVRGYVSCIAGCPYQGEVSIDKIIEITKKLIDMGVYEVSLGDTIGCGTPKQIRLIINKLIESGIDADKLAVHFHNTNGMAIQNIMVALEFGIRTIDSSIGGLGGCPYAKLDKNNKAVGNVSTLEVLKLINTLNLQLETEIDIEKIKEIDEWTRTNLL